MKYATTYFNVASTSVAYLASLGIFSIAHDSQYCQTRSVNILTRVCRELTRLSRSKHTLVNILTIDFTITKIVLLMETKPNQ